MKKKVLSAVLSAAAAMMLLAGCGDTAPATTAATDAPAEAASEAPAEAPAAEEPAAETVEAAAIPTDYKYYFPMDAAAPEVHRAVQDTAAGTVSIDDSKEVTYIPGAVGQAAYTDGTAGLKLDVNGVGTTYTVSYWLYATRFANYMPTLQFGPDIHGDATGGQHYTNITRSEWNPDGPSFPCVWSYDQAAEGSPWPNWAPDEPGEHLKEWMNITLTVDESELSEDGTLAIGHLYVNGEELKGYDGDGNERPVYITKGSMSASDNFDFLLGVNYWDSIFKGAFDEVYVYDRVLDPAEVKGIYAAGDTSVAFEEPERVITVEANPDALETLGTTDLTMGFWSDFSSAIPLEDGKTKIVTLKNYSDGLNSWDNYVLAFTNEETKAHENPNETGNADHKEYGVMRADAYAWIGDKNSADDTETFQFEYSWGNWNTWAQSVMADADVTLKVTRNGDTIQVEADNVDFNGTSNTMKGTMKCDLKPEDPCYMVITGEASYIEINSVKDQILVEADAAAVDHVGSTELTGAFWSDWTDGYELKDGDTRTVKLTNYSNGANNWENFVLAFCNTQTKGHEAPADQDPAYAEYAVLRADAYGWGDASYEGTFETSWGDDWAGWLEMMKDADVTVEISRDGGVINVKETFVGADGSEWTESGVVKSTMTAESPVYFFITNELCYNDILSVE